MKQPGLVCLFIVLLLLVCTAGLGAREAMSPEGEPILPGVAVLKIKPEYKDLLVLDGQRTGIPSIDEILQKLDVSSLSYYYSFDPKLMRPDLPDLSLVLELGFDPETSPYRAINMLSQDVHVAYAEPVYLMQALETPNDPNYSLSLYLEALQASDAWDIHKCESAATPVLIGIADTGVNWKHPDLAANIWNNLGEDANGNGYTIYFNGSTWVMDTGDLDGIDSDANGKVDDLIGWDFALDTSLNEGNDPSDPGSHGTIVAGIAGAVTNNNLGTASLSWNPVLMPMSCSMPGYTSTIFKGYHAVIYAAENGADVINCSWGSSSFSYANQDAINYATGLGSIVVAAAGNSNNSNPIYPSAYQNVVAVAALQNDGVKSSISSYGAHVDVGAPTGSMNSTVGSSYTTVNNATSYASPVGTALCALIRSQNPTWTNQQVIQQLINTCDDVDTINPSYTSMLGAGKLNAYRALSEINPPSSSQLKLAFMELLAPVDENGNQAVEPGESFSLNLRYRNYSTGPGTVQITFSLSSSSSWVQIIDSEYTTTATDDSYIDLSDAFDIYVLPGAPSQYISFDLLATSANPIVLGAESSFQVLVNNGGTFVWEGVAGARNMSGAFIRGRLNSLGVSNVYGTFFPASLYGFDQVFLSFGTPGASIVRLSSSQTYYAIRDYLQSGGRLYIEGGDAVGFDLQYYLAGIDEGVDGHLVLYPLLGIQSADDGDSNTIDHLDGSSGWLSQGLHFYGSNQTQVQSIDRFVPASNGLAAFSESDYGITAIQALDETAQRSFVSSYALRELIDEEEPSTRNTLLDRILSFFGSDELALPSVEDISIQQDQELELIWSYPFAVDYFGLEYSLDNEFFWQMDQSTGYQYQIPQPIPSRGFYRVKAYKSFTNPTN